MADVRAALRVTDELLWVLRRAGFAIATSQAIDAVRETLEEANARVEVGPLYALYNIPHINQVYMLFRARLLDLDFSAGAETLETKLFEEEQIPWDQIAFVTVRRTLRHYFDDRRAGEFHFHIGTIEPMPKPPAT